VTQTWILLFTLGMLAGLPAGYWLGCAYYSLLLPLAQMYASLHALDTSFIELMVALNATKRHA
jgi:hypothetical protein